MHKNQKGQRKFKRWTQQIAFLKPIVIKCPDFLREYCRIFIHV